MKLYSIFIPTTLFQVLQVLAFSSRKFPRQGTFLRGRKSIMDWSPLAQDRLEVEPQELVDTIPQLAKDVDYARAIQNAWKKELCSDFESESIPHIYQDIDGNDCYGQLIRIKRGDLEPSSSVPGVIFFHTGAGPHDIFLHWKADSLVTDMDIFADGCVVLVADILSDDSGWAWSPDRTKYNKARKEVLKLENGVRPNLQSKISAAIGAIKGIPGVDSNRLAAMGWCLGGHCILEMARINPKGINAMITFHGVFDGIPPPQDAIKDAAGCKILVCNGAEDMFVPSSSLQNAILTMKQNNHQVSLLNLAEAKHGFTNPAQDSNPDKAFSYNLDVAQTAWSSAKELLRCTLAVS